ncbi:MAG: FAD-binding domain-containing protein [Pseudomonadota bacterium]
MDTTPASPQAGGGAPMEWRATREAALARLDAFAPKTGRFYASQRNYDRGPDARGNVSALSPWISLRMILEEEVLAETLARGPYAPAEKFIQEVFWRGYFKGWLEHRPGVWKRYQYDVHQQIEALADDLGLARRYERAVNGQTGIDCFDAWADELTQTGYLHNHARMWFASIWIFTLKLPWALGADFFYRYLLDGDAASNTCSWRWVAGLHTQGKTYLARADNIRKFTDHRFEVASPLAAEAPALAEAPVEAPVAPDLETSAPSGAFGLLVTEEDCCPETLPLPLRPEVILVLSAPSARSPLPLGETAAGFISGALADTHKRAQGAIDSPCEISDDDAWAGTLIDWAKTHRLETIVCAYAPTGPVADRLREASEDIAAAGLNLHFTARPYDKAVWPHARKGFFNLKKKIPQILSDIDLV